jgi:hypothetical protein
MRSRDIDKMTLERMTFRTMLQGMRNLFKNTQQIITTLCLTTLNRITRDNNNQHNDTKNYGCMHNMALSKMTLR